MFSTCIRASVFYMLVHLVQVYKQLVCVGGMDQTCLMNHSYNVFLCKVLVLLSHLENFLEVNDLVSVQHAERVCP